MELGVTEKVKGGAEFYSLLSRKSMNVFIINLAVLARVLLIAAASYVRGVAVTLTWPQRGVHNPYL